MEKLDKLEAEVTRLKALEEQVERMKDNESQMLHLITTLLSRVSHLEQRDPQPSPSLLQKPIKPARPSSPADYNGDRARGRDFWNSCTLYMSMCPSEFPDAATQISWVLSYMKTGRAATFAGPAIEKLGNGEMPFPDFETFKREFRERFFPQNEKSTALNKLETEDYFQGRRSVQEYTDAFQDLIAKAGYSDGLTIVQKYKRGLSTPLRVAISKQKEPPAGDDPEAWYETAKQFANSDAETEAFEATTKPTTTRPTFARGTPFKFPAPKVPAPPTSAPPPPKPEPKSQVVPMDIDSSRSTRPTPPVCFRCGKPGHFKARCPQRHDIRLTDEEIRHLLGRLLKEATAGRGASQDELEVQSTSNGAAEDFTQDSE